MAYAALRKTAVGLLKYAMKRMAWQFLIVWTIANSLGYAGGGIVSAFVTDYITGDLGVFLSFGVMSMAIALAQWLAIRPYIRGFAWLWATWIGGTVGGFFSSWASFQLSFSYGDAVDLLMLYASLRGLTTGIAQWFVLRNIRDFEQSKPQWWIVVTTASWYLSVILGSLLIYKLGYFTTLVIGATYGLLTAITFCVYFRLPIDDTPQRNRP